MSLREIFKPKDQHKSLDPKKNKNSKRPAIMGITYTFVTLFLGMMGYLVYFAATSEQEMINNSYNSRQDILLAENYRGSIFADGGEVLAKTEIADDQSETRVYPYDNLFSHVVGYSTQGRTGIEALSNYYLINSNAPLSDKVVNEMSKLKNPGDDVYTSLNVTLQDVASHYLGSYRGAVIVTEPSTGKILAMVSKPDFDPNQITDIWDGLVEDTRSTVLLNRVTQGLYPPGSTFKIITALEYIRENPDSYEAYRYQCNGSFSLEDNKISCYHGTNHGSVDFVESFARSCNSSFANIGVSLDRGSFAKTLSELLFNKELPLTLTYAKSSIEMDEAMSIGNAMQTSIGQGRTQMTPMHLNIITCAIANQGVLMKPYVVDRIANSVGTIIKQYKPSNYGRLMSDEEAAILTSLMTAVVEDGTASRLDGLDYTAAGKTGSAEYNNVKGDSHAWFTGFAPVEDPQIAVTIIIEGAGSGGDYAVPIAKRIFDAYFGQTLN